MGRRRAAGRRGTRTSLNVQAKSRSLTGASPAAAVRTGWPAPRVDLIGIGVQKAATTWLFRCLTAHPAIRASTADGRRSKEINFFNHRWERGYTWYHRGFAFGPWKTVEYSNLYFHDRDVPGRIRRYNPEARLLLSLRDPIERAYSHHRHEVRRGRLGPELYGFRAAARQNPSYIEQGFYATHLERWLEHFDRDRIHVVDHADIRVRPGVVMEAVYAFAGVDSSFRPPPLREHVNRSFVVRSRTLRWLVRQGSSAVRAAFGDRAVQAAKATGVPGWLRRINRVPVKRLGVPPLTDADRAWLRDLFAPEVERLSELLERDFTHWSASGGEPTSVQHEPARGSGGADRE